MTRGEPMKEYFSVLVVEIKYIQIYTGAWNIFIKSHLESYQSLELLLS